jgi:hypothetical protein
MISDDAATNHNANEHVLKMMKFDTYKEDLRNKEEAMEDALLKLELSRHPASTNGGVHVFDLRTTPLP